MLRPILQYNDSVTETFVNVARHSSALFGITALLFTSAILVVGSAISLIKKRERPVALIAFGCLTMAVQFLPYPKEIWMGREVICICVLCLSLFGWQSDQGKPNMKRVSTSLRIGVFSLPVLSSVVFGHPNISTIALTPNWINPTGRRHFDALDVRHTTVDIADGHARITSTKGRDIEIENNDLYRDSNGRYLSGKEVAIQIDNWVKSHPGPKHRSASVN